MEENIRKKGSSGKKSWEKQLRFTVKHYSEVKCISKKKIETSRVKGNAKEGKQEETKHERNEGEKVANAERGRKKKKGREAKQRFTQGVAYVSTYADKNVLI